MADTNKGVVYTGPGSVEVQDLDYPKLELPEQDNRSLQHGVILKVVATNICGSDQHMVRGRTTAPQGQTLGHEITGEVAEDGRDDLDRAAVWAIRQFLTEPAAQDSAVWSSTRARTWSTPAVGYWLSGPTNQPNSGDPTPASRPGAPSSLPYPPIPLPGPSPEPAPARAA